MFDKRRASARISARSSIVVALKPFSRALPSWLRRYYTHSYTDYLGWRNGTGAVDELRDPVQRAVAALGRRQATALGGDRTALDAVRVIDDDVDGPVFGRVLGDLVDARGAHPAPCLRQLARNALLYPDVVRGVVARRVAADVDA